VENDEQYDNFCSSKIDKMGLFYWQELTLRKIQGEGNVAKKSNIP